MFVSNGNRRVTLAAALVLPLLAGCSYATRQTNDDPTIAAGADSAKIAYGATHRRNLTSSVSSLVVSPTDAAHCGRVEELMIGRLAGVQVQALPNGDYSVRIRGNSSAVDDGEPLYVVDGMPFPAGVSPRTLLRGMSPNDVARIDVIKDGGAAAYGIRGGNGVILITTRRFAP